MSRRVRASLITAVVFAIGCPAMGRADYSCTNCFDHVAAGGYHSCALRTDGTVACWGEPPAGHDWGQSAPPAGTFLQVSAGHDNSCAVKSDNTVACWGWNNYGQSTPLSGTFREVSAGYYHSCGVRTGGTVACWGRNDQLESAPPGGTFQEVAAGLAHTCGVRSDGTVACWGRNVEGQSTPPTGTFRQVSAGWSHTCGVRTDGTVACWGDNLHGESTPPAGAFQQVSTTYLHCCGVRTDGTVVCWGILGLPDWGQATPPAGLFRQVAAGEAHSCGVRANGSAVCWGYNADGEAWPPAGICGVFRDDLELGGDCRWKNGSTPCWSADCDGDGFASESGTSRCVSLPIGVPPECSGGSWTDRPAACGAFDCEDVNQNVFAGQTLYFPSGYTRAGPTPPRFDYNCNGVEEKEHGQISAGGLCCLWSSGFCRELFNAGCGHAGWDPATVLAVPACGATAGYLTCSGIGPACQPTTVQVTQACR